MNQISSMKLKRMMSHTSRIVMISLATLVLLSGIPALAQETGLRAEFPHPFIVENTTLPAGAYVIERISENSMDEWMIRSAGREPAASVLFLTQQAGPNPPSTTNPDELVFSKYGNEYYLTGFRIADEQFQLTASRALLRAEKAHGQPERMSVQGQTHYHS